MEANQVVQEMVNGTADMLNSKLSNASTELKAVREDMQALNEVIRIGKSSEGKIMAAISSYVREEIEIGPI